MEAFSDWPGPIYWVVQGLCFWREAIVLYLGCLTIASPFRLMFISAARRQGGQSSTGSLVGLRRTLTLIYWMVLPGYEFHLRLSGPKASQDIEPSMNNQGFAPLS